MPSATGTAEISAMNEDMHRAEGQRRDAELRLGRLSGTTRCW